MTTEKGRPDWQAILDVSIKVAFPILLGFASYTFLALGDHDRRLTTIEASRYTPKDARADRDKVADAMSELRQADAITTAELKHIRELLTQLTIEIKRREDQR